MKALIKKCSILVVAGFLFGSCADQYKETIRVLSVAPFSTLQIKSVFTIYLVQDTTYSVKIVADDAVINQIDAHVESNTLYLIDNNKQKWMNPENNKVTLYIHSPAHNGINAESTYSLYSTNTITANELWIINDGAVKLCDIDLNIDCQSFVYWNNYLSGGKLTLKGKCKSFNIGNFALHQINTVDLQSESGYISSYAKADSRIYVTDTLTCDLHGTGNIYVYGNPSTIIVDQNTSSGQVIRTN